MNRKGLSGGAWVFLIILVVGILATGGFFVGQNLLGDNQGGTKITQFGACPTDKDSSTTINLVNGVNESGEQLNTGVTVYAFDKDGGRISLTSGSASNLNCGADYTLRTISNKGNRTTSADVERITVSGGKASLNADGSISLTPEDSTVTIFAYTKDHGAIEFRAFDNNNNGFINATTAGHVAVGAIGSTSYATGDVTFHSSGSNSTAYDETAGIDVTFEVRARNATTDWNDLGTYILVDLPTDVFETPTMKVDGTSLDNKKGSLTPQESAGWADYEYIYLFDSPVKDAGDKIEARFLADLLSGASATADISIDFASKGAYLSNDGSTVKYGGVKDDSSFTDVYSIELMTLDIT